MKITGASISLGSRHILTEYYVQADFFTIFTSSRESLKHNFQDEKIIMSESYGVLKVKVGNIQFSNLNIRLYSDQSLLPELEQQKLQLIEKILQSVIGPSAKDRHFVKDNIIFLTS